MKARHTLLRRAVFVVVMAALAVFISVTIGYRIGSVNQMRNNCVEGFYKLNPDNPYVKETTKPICNKAFPYL